MTDVETRLKRAYPNYSDRIDKMTPIAKEIMNSKDYAKSMSAVVPTLDAMDAYVLGMMVGEFVKNGMLRIKLSQNDNNDICKEIKMSESMESHHIMKDIDNLIQGHMEMMKKHNHKPTRNDIIELVANRLEELLTAGSDMKEVTWIVSGVAVGIAIVLQTEDRLKMNT